MKKDKKKILLLLVEDEASVRHALSDKLKREGFEILEAKNGKEGLAVSLKEQPDLILLDLVMPRMDGLEMMRKLRKENEWGESVPIVILTNLAATDEITWAIAADEPVFYLVKSEWDIDKVVEKVKEALNIN